MTNEQIVQAARTLDTPHGKISLIHVRDDGQEVPTLMAQQFVKAIIAAATSESALDRYTECQGDEIDSPLERLRFFCSEAMTGQDWLDSEAFFNGLEAQIAKLEAENASLLMANRDCMDHFNQLKEDYDALVGEAK